MMKTLNQNDMIVFTFALDSSPIAMNYVDKRSATPIAITYIILYNPHPYNSFFNFTDRTHNILSHTSQIPSSNPLYN